MARIFVLYLSIVILSSLFNDMSTLVCHSVSFPRKMEKSDKRVRSEEIGESERKRKSERHCRNIKRRNTADSRYLEIQGTPEILRDIHTSTYQICKIEEKINRTTAHHKWICNLTPEDTDALNVLWIRGEIAVLFSTIFYYLLLDFHVKTRTRFSLQDKRLYEISVVQITRVDCTNMSLSAPAASRARSYHHPPIHKNGLRNPGPQPSLCFGLIVCFTSRKHAYIILTPLNPTFI